VTRDASENRQNGWWRDQTFLDDLRRNAQDRPDKPVLIAYRPPDDTKPRVVDYAELARVTDGFVAALVGLGIKHGDVVALQFPNWWEAAPLGLACAQVGARICLLMPIYGRHEIEHMLRRTGARLCITVTEWQGARLADIVADLAGQLPQLDHVVVADTVPGIPHPAGTLSFTEVFRTDPPAGADAAAKEPWSSLIALEPDEPFLILFTSGTTGESKGVVHSQNTLYAGCRAYAEPLGLDSSSVVFVAHTTMYYTGFVLGMLLPVMLGGTALVQEDWDADIHLDLVQRHGVTAFYGGPHILVDLIAAQRANPRDVSRLRRVVTGGAPIPPHVVEQVDEVLGAEAFALWGMTENGTVTITRSDDPPGWAAHSDGSVVDGMQVRIDTASGAGDGSGKLWVRGANQCLGYFGRDDLYAEALDEDGWFDTGDLVRDDGRGGIRVCGRVKDIVIHGGINVPVTDVEGILARHPSVREVAIIGVPDRDLDEQVCAVVAPAGGPPELAALRTHLASAGVTELFWPERLEVMDALPRTATGKVRKAELRARLRGT